MRASMQCSTGNKAAELDIISKTKINTTDIVINNKVQQTIIDIRSKEKNTSRNLLIRKVVHDVLYQTVIVPSKDMKRIVQEHSATKEIKLGK